MRQNIIFFLTIIIFACTPNKTKVFSSHDVSIISGTWLSTTYIDQLRLTKSVKMSQDNSGNAPTAIMIYEKNDTLRYTCIWNLHEGSDEDYFFQIENSTYKIMPRFGEEQNQNVRIKNDTTLILKSKNESFEFVKVSGKPDQEHLTFGIYKYFIAGNYTLNRSNITFQPNGMIEGNDSLKSYSVQLDYIGPPANFDIVNITQKNKDIQYGLIKKANVLEFYHVICEAIDSINGTCESLVMTDKAFNLIKK